VQSDHHPKCHLDVRVHSPGSLGEVAELVPHDRLELAQVEHVDQGQPDCQVPPGRHDQVDERHLGDDASVDFRRDEHVIRLRGADLVRELSQELEQHRLLVLGQFDLQLFLDGATIEQHADEHEGDATAHENDRYPETDSAPAGAEDEPPDDPGQGDENQQAVQTEEDDEASHHRGHVAGRFAADIREVGGDSGQ
jgi:hypothetical protein